MKKKYIKIIISIVLVSISIYFVWSDRNLLAQLDMSSNLKGKILLQVEEHGEAWYVYPYDLKRYYLGRPSDAFDMMRNLGMGISNNDIQKIPIAEANFEGLDSDEDGLSDAIEDSLGTDKNNPDTDGDGYSDKEEILNNYSPLGEEALEINNDLRKKMSGLIVMQVEQHGEAWYINPDDLKRYYLGRPADAFNLMRELGLGITNKNLVKIEEFKVNPEYKTETIVEKFTKIITGTDGSRKYTDPNNNYSFVYPTGWKIKKYEEQPYVTQITDAERDYITEKRGAISLRYFTTPQDMDISTFKIATKGDSKTLTDKEIIISGKNAYENSYEHLLAYEKTVTVEIGPKKYLQVTLATSKNNNSYYEGVLSNILNSLEISE